MRCQRNGSIPRAMEVLPSPKNVILPCWEPAPLALTSPGWGQVQQSAETEILRCRLCPPISTPLPVFLVSAFKKKITSRYTRVIFYRRFSVLDSELQHFSSRSRILPDLLRWSDALPEGHRLCDLPYLAILPPCPKQISNFNIMHVSYRSDSSRIFRIHLLPACQCLGAIFLFFFYPRGPWDVKRPIYFKKRWISTEERGTLINTPVCLR